MPERPVDADRGVDGDPSEPSTMEDGSEAHRGAITQLDDRTIQRIAAGEVVERPASVVKELVENSLDAGADRIDVTVEGETATDRIVVEDDGHGIDPDELALAVQPHTTSKIRALDDLERGPGSLGFRGEALHAIGQVSRLTIETRPPGESGGARVVVDGGDVVEEGPTGVPTGTRVTVEGLFDPVPARRKFLDAPVTERGHVRRTVAHLALANPSVAIGLTVHGSERFVTEGTGQRREAVAAVHGRAVAESMLDIEADGDLPDGVASVTGLISDPETTRSSPEYLTTVVNGRPVTASALRRPIVAGYGDRLGPDRYPFAVCCIEVDATAVDVNVHPRKHEVHFDDVDAIETAIRRSVATTLDAHTAVPTAPPRTGTSAEAAVEGHDGPRPAIDLGSVTSGGEQATLPGTPRHPGDAGFERLPALRIIGQAHDAYIVAETDDGLVLVDQHAADERINYERLVAAVTEGTHRQTLATPVEVPLAASEAEVLEANRDAIADLGFEVRGLVGETARLGAVPAVLGQTLPPDALADALQRLLGAIETGDADRPVAEAADPMLADLACHPSITANESLRDGSMVALLDALDDCDSPWTCPHGRPTIIEVTGDELDRRFERDYPGAMPCRRWDGD